MVRRILNFVVLDIKTTNMSLHGQITQVELVRIENNEWKHAYTSSIQNGESSTSSLENVIADILPLLEDCTLVGNDVNFQYHCLQRALDECGYMPFQGAAIELSDCLYIAFPSLPSLQLSVVCDALGIDSLLDQNGTNHDVYKIAHVWLKCLEKLNELPLLTLQRLAAIFADETDDFSQFIHQLRERKELESAAGYLQNESAYRQLHLRVQEWVNEEPVVRDGQSLPATFDEFLEEALQRIEQLYPQFERRDAQLEMMREVYDALDHDHHLLIEAGTGTGKSLGYLLPAAYFAVTRDEPVVVSTHTIHLQEQLKERDVPLIQQWLPLPFRTSVFKGRNHYLCLRKFEHQINLRDFRHLQEKKVAAQLVVWLGETEQGDVEELNLNQDTKIFWQSVESDTDSCLNRACPWFKRCYYHRARHLAQISDVVITNHSMLLTDVKAEHRLLPIYDRLIIDEAHQFEEVAEKHLGYELHYYSFVQTLNRLYRDPQNGWLPTLKRRLEGSGYDSAEKWIDVIEDQYKTIAELVKEWDVLVDQLYSFIQKNNGQASSTETGVITYRIHPDHAMDIFAPILSIEDNIYTMCGEMIRKLDSTFKEIREAAEDDTELVALLTDVNGALKDLATYRETLRFIIHPEAKDFVYWLEASTNYRAKSLQFIAAPIDVGSLLQQHFFEEKSTMVMTSATLTVNGTFDYYRSQMGMDHNEASYQWKEVMLTSPFQYRRQALVVIPRDFPKVNGFEGERKFIEQLAPSLAEVAKLTGGKMLVLFTSYRMLRQTYERLVEQIGDAEIDVLGQGITDGNRSKLINLFMQERASILLGTSSFWEGVDIPGEALTCLVIVRLPFQPPTHPVVEAKCERLKSQNKNPFMSYSVPQAVIRFKQGFGRLVRTTSDRGIVIVYDTRVIDTRYGKHFLYSLPGPKIEHMNTSQLAHRIRDWLHDCETIEQGVKEEKQANVRK